MDWHETPLSHIGSASAKSVPVHSISKREAIERNAASLFDSDSSDEYRRQRMQPPLIVGGNMRRKSGSLFQVLTGSSLDDDEAAEEDDIMILTDNSDYDDERVGLQRSRLASLNRSLQYIGRSSKEIYQSSSVVSSSSSIFERGRISALFADDKPWASNTDDDDDDATNPGTKRLNSSRAMLDMPIFFDASDHDEERDSNHSRELLLPPPPPAHQEEAESTDSEWSGDLMEGNSIHSDLSGLSVVQLEEQVDFDKFTIIPNSFLGSGQLHPCMASLVDAGELEIVTARDANHFVLEHTIMLRAILQLLHDQELHQSFGDVILKKGSLKKLGHSVGRQTWKVKYVEVGYGSFSYYKDSNMKERKTIVLKGASAVEVNDNVNFCFELHTSNNKKVLWMANSEEERQSWIKKIKIGMTGKPRQELDLAPYQLSIERFLRMQNNLRLCQDKDAYLSLCGEMWETDVRLPTAYLSVRTDTGTKGRSVADFWKFLGKTTVVLNGHAILADSPHCAERILGTLSRCLLEYGRSGDHTKEHTLTEVQALTYSRDVLMGVWQSRSHDDSHHLIDTMTQNVNLTICLPYKEDANVYLQVAYTTEDDLVDSTHKDSQDDLSGWVRTRSKAFRNWKNRYIVISESVLSYYANGSPRPHGLRGQIALAGAKLQQIDDKQESHLFIIKITTKDERERQLSFRDETEYLEWKVVLQKAIDSCTPLGAIFSKAARRRPGRALIKGATRDTGRMIKGAADGGFILLQRGLGVVKKTVSFESSKLDETEALPARASELSKYHEPTVRLTAEACSYYKIITSDPSGNDKNDTWITVRAKTSQDFLLSGGSHGRINKGEEVVVLTFREGLVDQDDFGENNRTYDVSSNYSRSSLF